MRHKLSWSDLTGQSVGVWGLGVEGGASVRKLRTLGIEPALVDDQPDPATDGVLATDEGGIEALAQCDVVIKSPGISRYRPDVTDLEAAGTPVVGGLGLWLEETDLERVITITGTKGKSTTSAITAHMLERLGHSTQLVGNIGLAPWDTEVTSVPEYWIVETSSFQATDMASTPPVVAVTSLHPDHLDWHEGAENYYRDKLSACSQPGANVTIADAESPLLVAREHLLGPHVRWVTTGQGDARWTESLGLLGDHNERNARIARSILVELGIPEAGDDAAMAQAARDFKGLASRLTTLGSIGDVLFVDDSLSTNVLPTLAALDAFPARRVALLVGGFDRGIDYEALGEAIAARSTDTLAVTMPDNGPRIGASISQRSAGTAVVDADDLVAAVRIAYEWAQPGGVVLCSPAAPSFGKFKNYKDRAEAFAAALAELQRDAD